MGLITVILDKLAYPVIPSAVEESLTILPEKTRDVSTTLDMTKT
jgi:hypothetical protein